MKIAGRKNDGAWYRTNKRIKNMTEAEKTNLALIISEIDTLPDFITAMADLAEQTGAVLPPNLSDPTTYAESLTDIGIPRQVWMGLLSYDTYSPDPTDDTNFLPDHADPVRLFANDLRTIVTRALFGMRALRDIGNIASRAEGNPGGIADATKGN